MWRAKDRGVERMEMIETELRNKREERECILNIIAEEEEKSRRLKRRAG